MTSQRTSLSNLNKSNSGTAHWLSQRVWSVILIPITLFFVFSYVQHLGLDYKQNLLVYKNPIMAFLTFLFISITLLHFKQGAEVVIEDYIHGEKAQNLILKINTIFFVLMTTLIALALISIVFRHYWS